MSKDIYIVLTMTGTYISRLLNVFYGKEYVHVSIALDSELKEMYSFGRRNMLVPIIGGLVKEDIHSGIFTEHDVKCKVLKVKVTEEQYKSISKLIHDCMSDYSKYRYNLMGLILLYLNIRYERKTHFTCSQFVAMLLDKSNTYRFHASWSLAKPMDFEEIDNTELVYEGLLKNYNVQALAG